MKKLLSIIVALSMCGSFMTLSATTASAATVETQAVSEAYVDSDLETQLDKMSANDTVAVIATITPENPADSVDLREFAKKNGLEDQVEFDEDGMIVDCTEDFISTYLIWSINSGLKECDKNYNIIKDKYCESVLCYERIESVVVCISTKSQVEALIDSGCVTELELADKKYIVPEYELTWEEFYKMNDDVRAAYSQLKGVECTEEKYDVTFGDYIYDDCMLVAVNESEIKSIKSVVKRSDDIVWMQSALGLDMYIYLDGDLYTLGDVYKQGKLTFDVFKEEGGMYFGDINSDDIVDVNDVTQLQLNLANNTSNPLIDILTGFASAYYDVNSDSYVDVTDVTTLQMYLAGYDV